MKSLWLVLLILGICMIEKSVITSDAFYLIVGIIDILLGIGGLLSK